MPGDIATILAREVDHKCFHADAEQELRRRARVAREKVYKAHALITTLSVKDVMVEQLLREALSELGR